MLVQLGVHLGFHSIDTLLGYWRTLRHIEDLGDGLSDPLMHLIKCILPKRGWLLDNSFHWLLFWLLVTPSGSLLQILQMLLLLIEIPQKSTLLLQFFSGWLHRHLRFWLRDQLRSKAHDLVVGGRHHDFLGFLLGFGVVFLEVRLLFLLKLLLQHYPLLCLLRLPLHLLLLLNLLQGPIEDALLPAGLPVVDRGVGGQGGGDGGRGEQEGDYQGNSFLHFQL